ncbi:sulfotransferase 1C2-like [Ixodes scapularis]
MTTQLHRDIDGLYISRFIHEDNIRSALAYAPRRDDLFIATYPKCGTTWVQYIVYNMISEGTPPEDLNEFMLRMPFLEFLGAEGVEKMIRPGAIKTHLPFSKCPFSKEAKYICIARNPFDCCVSYYYHTKSAPVLQVQDLTFEQYFEMFINGRVGYGDYIDHLLAWYKHRNDSNVLFFTFEQLKKDKRGHILKIADFMGEQYGKVLREDEVLLNKILDATSLESMKKVFKNGLKTIMSSLASLPPESRPESLNVYKSMSVVSRNFKSTGEFLRKGEVGGYMDHFSPEQIFRIKDRIASRTEGSDVMTLWKEDGLP